MGGGFYRQQRTGARPCKDCGEQVEWKPTNDGRLNKRGDPLQLPFEVGTGRQHRCQAYLDRMRKDYGGSSNAEKAKGVMCRNGCGTRIMFSADQRSPTSGKMIPLEMDGSTPHQCPNKPQQQQQGQQQQQQYPNQLSFNNPATTTATAGATAAGRVTQPSAKPVPPQEPEEEERRDEWL